VAPANDDGTRKILFKLIRPNAKEIMIVGDFNNWMRQPLVKKGKSWEVSVPLKPGSYEYAFVVDGRRVRDPNNKQAGSNGKSSIITVKPLGKQP
jgi:1,4-alpha-glucan branching enzyme